MTSCPSPCPTLDYTVEFNLFLGLNYFDDHKKAWGLILTHCSLLYLLSAKESSSYTNKGDSLISKYLSIYF